MRKVAAVLVDIDGTLITTGGAGAVAWCLALEERRLVRALRNREEWAYAELHERYDARLVSLASSHGLPRAVAQEVVQDTWAAVARSIHTFQGRSSLKTWIFRILVNAANSQAKRERRVVPLPVVETPGTVATPHEQVVWRELLPRVRAAIERLSPAQRNVIVLRDIQGLSSEEVCDHLEISEINQRVLLHRAPVCAASSLPISRPRRLSFTSWPKRWRRTDEFGQSGQSLVTRTKRLKRRAA